MGEKVEGVLEVLDKADKASFGPDDLTTLANFACPAARAVEHARTAARAAALLLQEPVRLAEERGDDCRCGGPAGYALAWGRCSSIAPDARGCGGPVVAQGTPLGEQALPDRDQRQLGRAAPTLLPG